MDPKAIWQAMQGVTAGIILVFVLLGMTVKQYLVPGFIYKQLKAERDALFKKVSGVDLSVPEDVVPPKS